MTQEYLLNLREKVLKLENVNDIEKIMNYKTMYQRFEEVASQKPDSPAIYYMGNVFTYRQMLSLIDIAAKGFLEIGIGYNDVVAMSMLAEPFGIVSLYALDKIGAVMHMVNTLSSVDEIKRELKKVNSKYFVANDIFCGNKMQEVLFSCGIEKIIASSLTDCIPKTISQDKIQYEIIEMLKGVSYRKYDGNKMISFSQLLDMGRNSNKIINSVEFVPNKLVTIAYTSGTSGDSKACMATWERIDSMVQIMGMTELGRFESTDKMFTTFPLWIYYCLLNMIHEPLTLGVALALDPVFDPKNIVRRNKQYKFNHWLTIAPYIEKMVDMNKKMDCSNWKIVLTGGSALSNKLKLRADDYIVKNGGKIKLVQGYGASEMLGSFAYCYYPDSSLGSLGKPCVGNRIKVLDIDTHKEVSVGEVGVGYLYSPARMTGYYGDEETTNKSLITDENGVVWYNSEDLLHVNDQGEIFLDGRIRRIELTFDSDGNPTKLIPDRPKKIISEMPEVMDCEIIIVPDDKVVNKAVACVVPIEGILPTKELKNKIITTCQENIPVYMVPSDILFFDELPKLSNQKNDLQKLEEIYINDNSQVKTKKRKR